MPSTPNRLLKIYLADHLAAATAGVGRLPVAPPGAMLAQNSETFFGGWPAS